MSFTDTVIAYLDGFKFVELSKRPSLTSDDEVWAWQIQGDVFGISANVSALMERQHGDETEVLIVHLSFNAVPGVFQPNMATCVFADGTKWQWERSSLDLEAPEPPQFFVDLVQRVTEELAIKQLGEPYQRAKARADAAWEAHVHHGFDV